MNDVVRDRPGPHRELDGLGRDPHSIFESMIEGVQIVDPEFRYVYLNRAAAEHGRQDREALIGRRMSDVYPGIERTEMFEVLRRSMRDRTPGQMVNRFTYPDGRAGWFDLRFDPVPMGVMILSIDVSAAKVAEEQTRLSREHLATTLNCMADGVVTTDVAGRVVGMNPAAERLTGWPEGEAAGRPLDELIGFRNQSTGEAVVHPVRRVLREGARLGLANDTLLVARDGTEVPIASSGAPMRHVDGSIRGVVLVMRDMTEEYRLTAMLHHAQRMEAVGRLAGGVAHDFNNVLTIIMGYADSVLDEVRDRPDLRADVEQVKLAGERAASLTRQLLAFSRRQVLRPVVLDLNGVVERMEVMLRRLIGEDIDLVTRLAPGLSTVEFDPGQLEQIIMNLAVNARDAMRSGGKLTIETADVVLDDDYVSSHLGASNGPHVMLAVTDTGTGMDPATQQRIFEPFFTTKGRDEGTGLGLSTVFGIVKQSGGNIWVYSEPGHGTTFKVYLPASPKSVARSVSTPSATAPAGHETILVVEDDAGVRRFVGSVLERGGYAVLAAEDADEALRACRAHRGEIHLVLTDVVMPGISGPRLAERIVAERPAIKVVYMSGYTDNAIVHHGVLDAGIAFIEKPFSPTTLLRRIRRFLDGDADSG